MTMPPRHFSPQPSSGASSSSPSSSFSSGDGGDSVDLARPAEEGADLAVYTIGSGSNSGGGGKRCIHYISKRNCTLQKYLGKIVRRSKPGGPGGGGITATVVEIRQGFCAL